MSDVVESGWSDLAPKGVAIGSYLSAWEDQTPRGYEILTCRSAYNDTAPRVRWKILPEIPRQRVFIGILKASGYDDFEVPISTVTIRLRNVSGSYIGCTVPNPESYTQQILARIPGRVHILAGELVSGIRQAEELIYGNIQNIYFNRGLSNTLTIAASRFITHRNPNTQQLTGVSRVRKSESGNYSIRCAVDFFIKPSDTAVYGTISFLIDMVTFVITAQNAYMEVEGS